MRLIEHLDFAGIFEKVKENHLKEYETPEDYINIVMWDEKETNWVFNMYNFLNNFPDASIWMSEYELEDIYNSTENTLDIEWCVGGNDSNESGNNYWGYGWIFTVNLEDEVFTGFRQENYS